MQTLASCGSINDLASIVLNLQNGVSLRFLPICPGLAKCLCIYQYWIHPVFGFMNARLQTWFPFPITIFLVSNHNTPSSRAGREKWAPAARSMPTPGGKVE